MDSNVMESGCGLSLDTSSVCALLVATMSRLSRSQARKGTTGCKLFILCQVARQTGGSHCHRCLWRDRGRLKKKHIKRLTDIFPPFFVFVLQMLASP